MQPLIHGLWGDNSKIDNMEPSTESRVSLKCFLTGLCLLLLPFLSTFSYNFQHTWNEWKLIIIFFYLIILNVYLYLYYKHENNVYQIAVRSGCLGLAAAIGFVLSFSQTLWVHFGWYLAALAFFHWSEYYTTAITNPCSLKLSSFLLDHSLSYQLAAVSSWMEYFIEWYFFPGLKQYKWISLFGVCLVVGGELLRKCSMLTAKKNFNHYVQHIKQPDHVLVTSGVYSLFRHPAYVGWFYWSIGTQLVLCNPVCLVAYTVVSWRFFNERIHDEEILLLSFFGNEYKNYQNKVGTGLPFISGYTFHSSQNS